MGVSQQGWRRDAFVGREGRWAVCAGTKWGQEDWEAGPCSPSRASAARPRPALGQGHSPSPWGLTHCGGPCPAPKTWEMFPKTHPHSPGRRCPSLARTWDHEPKYKLKAAIL